MVSVFFFAIRFHVCSQFADGAIEFLSLMFPLRLFGRGIYIKRSSSLHLVLHILQVVAWFPISLMCLSDDCSAVNPSADWVLCGTTCFCSSSAHVRRHVQHFFNFCLHVEALHCFCRSFYQCQTILLGL